MKKHWTQLLPEAGRIADAGLKQIALKEKMNQLQIEIMRLSTEFNFNEDSLQQLALTAWTPEEIATAKSEAYPL